MNKELQKDLPYEAIIKNYCEAEKSLVAQLNFQVPNHPPTIGGFREEIWKQLFEQIIPKKYVIEQSVFLMDSAGNVSDEVDLAIFDEMYTPYIFRNGRIKFIPIEAVAAVVQCKSTNVSSKNKGTDDYSLKSWSKNIDKLKTSRDSITRIVNDIITDAAPTQKGTRPIKIFCALKKPPQALMDEFDFYIMADKDIFPDKIDIIIPHENDWDLGKWHYELNMRIPKNESEFNEKKLNRTLADYRVEYQGQLIALLTLNFQLNQLLMLINNPMLFPHKAYVNMFNGKGGLGKHDEKNSYEHS